MLNIFDQQNVPVVERENGDASFNNKDDTVKVDTTPSKTKDDKKTKMVSSQIQNK